MTEKVLKWGIYIVVFGLPLYLIRFEVFGFPTTVLEIMIYALFMVWLIKNFKASEFLKPIKENRLLFWAIFLILCGATMATFRSWNLRLSFGILKAWFLDPILFFIVFVSTIKSGKEIKNVLRALIFSGLVVSVASLVYLFSGELNIDGRLQGPYDSPNYLAMYLAPIFVVVFWYYFFTFLVRPSEANSGLSPSLVASGDTMLAFGPKTRSKITPKHLLILLITSCLLPILFCAGSFGAWMGVIGAIGFGLIMWLWGLKKRKIALILALLLVFLCVGLYFLKFSAPQGRLSINSRLEIWQTAIEGVVIYPVVGIGPGTFKDFFPDRPTWEVPQPHNLYLAFLLQTGIIGFIGFVLLLVWFFGPKANQPRADKTRLLLIMIMIYILIHGSVDTTYWKNDLSVMFWVVVGIMVVGKLKTKNEKVKTII